MADEIYMDIPVISGYADDFESINLELKTLKGAVQAAILALEASAFTGNFASKVQTDYLEGILSKIDTFATACEEMSGDLKASADAYEKGDELGATKFH